MYRRTLASAHMESLPDTAHPLLFRPREYIIEIGPRNQRKTTQKSSLSRRVGNFDRARSMFDSTQTKSNREYLLDKSNWTRPIHNSKLEVFDTPISSAYALKSLKIKFVCLMHITIPFLLRPLKSYRRHVGIHDIMI
jgi:hypothetical protein